MNRRIYCAGVVEIRELRGSTENLMAVRYSPSITISANEDIQKISIPTVDKKPLEIAIALTARLTAPAPTDCIST